MKRVTISSLIVEITRRCNMACDHCVRGDAQCLDISDEVIAAMLKDVRYIGSITFTGGEPTLNVGAIERITAALRERRIDVGSFFVVTNGKTSPKAAKRMALALLDLFSECTDSLEDGMYGLIVSGDAWHEPVKVPAIYEGLAFFKRDERHGPRDEDCVICDGRAADNGIGRRKPERTLPLHVDTYEGDEDEEGQIEMVYVAANGNVMADCDHPYEVIDTTNRGNVLRESLAEIATREVELTKETVEA